MVTIPIWPGRESLKVFLEKKLRGIKTEVFRLTGEYRVSSVKELEELYKKGEIEEEPPKCCNS